MGWVKEGRLNDVCGRDNFPEQRQPPQGPLTYSHSKMAERRRRLWHCTGKNFLDFGGVFGTWWRCVDVSRDREDIWNPQELL